MGLTAHYLERNYIQAMALGPMALGPMALKLVDLIINPYWPLGLGPWGPVA